MGRSGPSATSSGGAAGLGRSRHSAPRLAARRRAAAGRTPQDQSGNGIPRSAALKTERKRPRPKWRATVPGASTTPTRPLISKPKRIYTAASRRSCQDANNTSKRTFILLFHTFSGRCSAAGQGGIFAAGRGRQVCFAQPHPRCLITSSERVSSWA